MTKMTDEVRDVFSLMVSQYRNRLHKWLFLELASRGGSWTDVAHFRSRSVCLSVAVESVGPDSLAVMIRGQALPFTLTRGEVFANFLKRQDESWTDDLEDEELFERLKKVCSEPPLV